MKENAKTNKKNKAFHMADSRGGGRGRLGGVSTTDDEESHLGIMKVHRKFISPHT